MEETPDELDQLDQLLRADIEENNPTENLREVNIFATNQSCEKTSEDKNLPTTSAVHTGITDASYDEGRNFTERKCNYYGTQIKKALANQVGEQLDKRIEFESRLRQTNNVAKVVKKVTFSKNLIITSDQSKIFKNTFCVPETKAKGPSYFYTDPIFGIRITKPLISSSALLDRMQGREAVNMLRVKKYLENKDLSKDWVIAGVIVRKSSTIKSQKGNNFIIWTLSDLKDDLKTVSMFLFCKAYNELWKTPEGTVVAVLNPKVLKRSQNSTDQACLSVENSYRVMVLGQSKDLGICRSKKKNGQPCTAFVNLSQCEHCIYHVKQEHQKYSQRQALKSSTMGKGIVNLQNKVYGKNILINKKMKDRNQNRLMLLSDYYKSKGDSLTSSRAQKNACLMTGNNKILHSLTAQRITDTKILSSLTNGNKNSNLSPSQNLAEKVSNSPTLGKKFSLIGSGCIDLNMSYSQKNAEKAKLNAIRLIQQKGGIEKHNPNNIKGTETGKKQTLDRLNNSVSDENGSKRAKVNEEKGIKLRPIMSERLKKIFKATSAHEHNPNNIKGAETGKKQTLDRLNNSVSDENGSRRAKVNEEKGIKLRPIMSERLKKIFEATSAHEYNPNNIKGAETRKIKALDRLNNSVSDENGSKRAKVNEEKGIKLRPIMSERLKKIFEATSAHEHNPNNIKGTETGKKQALDRLNNSVSDENGSKRAKVNEEKGIKLRPIMSERLKKIFEATSAPEHNPKNIKGTETGKIKALDRLNNSVSDENGSKRAKVNEEKGIKLRPIMSERLKKIFEATSAHEHNPNNIKGTETGKKQALDRLNNSVSDENGSKRAKVNEEKGVKLRPIMSERLKKIFEATLAHANLIKEHEADEQEKYFNKLEKKEAMEEKMLNTFKLPCKVIKCVKCKYTAFSAAQICKDERHPLKVLYTFKRFLKCADCNNRTVSLELLPLRSCSNCKGSRWEKAPMLCEKKVTSLSAGLSIRGEEETIIGGQVTAGKNIDLLVSDS